MRGWIALPLHVSGNWKDIAINMTFLVYLYKECEVKFLIYSYVDECAVGIQFVFPVNASGTFNHTMIANPECSLFAVH